MFRARRWLTISGGAVWFLALVGCQAVERAPISFGYVVEAGRGLPDNMKTISIMPANVGPTTDPKWSALAASVLQGLVHESQTSYGTQLRISDRRDTQVAFEEADLAAAGMSTRKTDSGGEVLAADGAILSNISVKMQKYAGRQRTLSGLGLAGFGGHGWGAGAADIETSQVDTVTRSLTVLTEFKLIDTANNQVWEHYAPRTFTATDRTKVSPIFGSGQTEAALTPEDEIIASLVDRGAREFISRLMPCRINVDTEVVSSRNRHCIQGVKLLRGEFFGQALAMFNMALSNDPDDHHAAFGAGVACEATARYHDALRYYRRACLGANSRKYREARDRMKAYGKRIRE